MASTKKVIIVAGILGILYWLSQRTLRKITYGAPTMRVHKLTWDGIELRIILPIVNESDIPASVTGFIGHLYYNSSTTGKPVYNDLGLVQLVAPSDIPGFGTGTVEMALKSGWVGSLLEIMTIITNGNPFDFSKVKYENIDWKRFVIQGTLKVSNIPIDITSQLVA